MTHLYFCWGILSPQKILFALDISLTVPALHLLATREDSHIMVSIRDVLYHFLINNLYMTAGASSNNHTSF